MDLDTIVKRLKVSVNLVKAATMDSGLRDLLLNYMLHDALKAGHVVKVPIGVKLEELSEVAFLGDREALQRAEVH